MQRQSILHRTSRPKQRQMTFSLGLTYGGLIGLFILALSLVVVHFTTTKSHPVIEGEYSQECESYRTSLYYNHAADEKMEAKCRKFFDADYFSK